MASNERIPATRLLRLTLISAAVSSCFASGTAMANPTGANVVRGTAAIHQAGNLLQITNSPNAIINWQSFSIGQNEITRFLQQSPSSAVLNRVTSQNNPSQILGSLQSRLLDGTTTGGRVFLINPNGILFGSGAQIDVGGLVASTLNMSNEDFLAGRMRFTDGLGKAVVNQGAISTPAGGHVYLVGPAVKNEGIITSPQGEVVLAAGNSVELVNPGTPNLRVEITAPDNQAINLGQIVADSGRIGIYAGLVNQSGVVQANTAVLTEDGKIVLKATNSAVLAAGSSTISTGSLDIEAGDSVVVSGNVMSGPQTVTAGGGLIVKGDGTGAAQLVANGGQTINAQFVEVIAPSTGFASISNNASGDQIITTTGMNAAGEGLAIRNNGGIFAEIRQNAPGQQVINVSNADRMAVDGSAGGGVGILASNGRQVISVTGDGANALLVGSAGGLSISNITGATQSVTAGLPGQDGSITITGPAQNVRFVGIRTVGGVGPQQQVISTSGPISITGGSATAQTISSGIFHTGTGPQDVSASAIALQGGSSGSGNSAQINSGTADQRITVGTGGIGLQAGAGGTNNGALILGANQVITTTGDVTVTGAGTSAAIGGPSGTAHSLLLTAGGDVVLTGGSAAGAGALIGTTGGAPLSPTNIAINAAGNVILTGGTGANARIGSSINVPATGGDISISAGENIQLNSLAQSARIRTLGNVTLNAGGIISESPNSLIEAGRLTTTSSAGTSLTGPNQVTSFNAANTATGDVVFSNSSPLLTVTGVSQVPSGALTINQTGDLTFTGTINSGPQMIGATGDISVLASSSTAVSANGTQTVNAGGTLSLVAATSGTNNFARLRATDGQEISATDIVIIGGGGTGNFAEILQTGAGAGQTINASSISLAGGTGGSSNAARIQNNGTAAQTITGSPIITITGGNGGIVDQGNSASIFSTGPQDITAASIAVTAGGAGFNNFAGINAPVQVITVQGDLTLTGGASANGPLRDGAARIGGRPNPATPTDLTLTVGGDVTMIGGDMPFAGPVIGSHFLGGQPTDITMNVGGNLVLNSGTVANAGSRIGSPSGAPAGGNISVVVGGDLVLNSAPGLQGSVIRTTDNIALQANSIVQGPNARVNAGSLTTHTVNGASLTGSNQVASFNATNTTSGDVALNNATPLLTVTGVSQVPFGALAINQAGDLALTGTISSGPQNFNATGNISVLPSSPTFVSSFGPQSITAGGGLIVQSSAAGAAQLFANGGQTINARYVEVTAQDNPAFVSNSLSGDQLITTTGMNAAGEGLAVRNLGGPGAFANIGQSAPDAAQVINVFNADRVTVDSPGAGVAGIFGFNNMQTLSISGAGANALVLGNPGSLGASQIAGASFQSVTAGSGSAGEQGSITIYGRAAGSGGSSILVTQPVPGGTQTVSTPGALTVIGGTAPTGASSGVFANGIGGQQRINAGSIVLQGGSAGSGNSADIGANRPDASQTITVDGGGIALRGGAGGAGNGAFILGSNQDISATGDVTLAGGSAGNSAILGGRNNLPTDLLLSAGGDVVLTGGSGANAGANIGTSGGAPLQPTNMVINAGGSVILNSGAGSGARIGSSINAPAAGGDISINAGSDILLNGTAQPTRIRTLGNVTLNAGGTISEGPNGLVEAAGLTTTSGGGTSLIGPNQVAIFNATNTATGDIALVNSGNLVAMASNAAPGGKIAIHNLAGDLATSGPIAASGGGAADVTLATAGAVNLAHAVTASGTGNVSLAGSAITVDDTAVTAGGSVAVSGGSLDVKGVSSGALIQAGSGFDANLTGDLRVRSASTGGAFGGWSAILAGNGPVSISAGNVEIAGGGNLGGFAAITGGPVAINATGDIGIAGGAGLGAFGLLSSYRDISLTVGGNVRLDSGTGLGSFARVQTLLPGSTISIHFPDLASGGYFVNDVEGRISQGPSGFFNGIRPAQLGRTLIVTYGE